jgi:flagellar biosynthesis anti-sigma factor FlgM
MAQIKFNGGAEIDPRLVAGPIEADRAADGEAAPQKAGSSALKIHDSISVSDRAAEIGELAARVKDIPGIRQERVTQFLAQVQAGEYHPPAADVADAILRDAAETAETI